MYKNKSVPKIESSSTPTDCATVFINEPLDVLSPYRGSISIWALYLYPSLTALFIWIAKFGIITKSLSIFTKWVFTRLPSFTRILPAIDSGRSNHVEHIIPPYFSVFNFTYLLFTSISAFSFILNVGESLWLATIWKFLKSFSGILNAIIDDKFLVT